MGGCSCRSKLVKITKDITVNSEVVIKDDYSYTKDHDLQTVQKNDKGKIKRVSEKSLDKEKSMILDYIKTEIYDKKDKSIIVQISRSSQNKDIVNKINKKKVIKKVDDRIHEAMNELKLLTLKEIKKNQKFFKLKN